MEPVGRLYCVSLKRFGIGKGNIGSGEAGFQIRLVHFSASWCAFQWVFSNCLQCHSLFFDFFVTYIFFFRYGRGFDFLFFSMEGDAGYSPASQLNRLKSWISSTVAHNRLVNINSRCKCKIKLGAVLVELISYYPQLSAEQSLWGGGVKC